MTIPPLSRDIESWQPQRIASGPGADRVLAEFRHTHPACDVVDQYTKNLEELFLLRHPQYRFNKDYRDALEEFRAAHDGMEGSDAQGAWFYFPWLRTLVHYLSDAEHFELRTGRNRNLINAEEQERYAGATVAIAGMSVGSHIAIVLAMTGGPRHMKLADPDVLSGDNLNRIRIGFSTVGINKSIAVARHLYEIDPYATIELYPDGVTEENAAQFLSGAALVVEEMDDPYWKFRLRELARAERIPVVMGTDNGDGVIVDIERFDREPRRAFFHGLAGDLSAGALKDMKPGELPRVAAQIAGANLAPARMLESVAEVGRTLYSWPQLGTAANLCGSAVAYCARRIILGADNLRSGRYQVNLDGIFESDYHSWRRRWGRIAAFWDFVRTMKKRNSS